MAKMRWGCIGAFVLACSSATVRAAEPKAEPSASDRPTFVPTLRINLRGEARTQAGQSYDPTASTWQVVQGVRAGVRAQYRELTAVAQIQDVRAWGDGSILSTDPLAGLHQGYIEVGGDANQLVSGFIRLGRQEIAYGSKRHFHRSPWAASGRAFDAVRGQLRVGRASVEAAYMLADRPRTFDAVQPDESTVTTRGRGDHLAYSDIGYAFHDAAELHGAVIVQRLGARANDTTRNRFFIMPGGRITGRLLEGLDYEAEAWFQRGEDRDLDMSAWMVAAAVGYEAPVTMRPGARLHYEILSGSECVGDAVAGEACGNDTHRDFDQLDGARHKYRGWMDLFAGSNLRDLAATVFVSPIPQLKALATYHFLQLDAASGRWYRLSGETTWGDGWDASNANRNLGHEVDLQISYKPWKYLTIRPGYSVFAKGPAARRLLPPAAMHFAYLWFVADF